MNTVKGKFEVKAIPLEPDNLEKDIGANRMIFEKKFIGDLEATSIVSMIGIMNKDLGSGAYVAIERIEGSLNGRKGTFCLQHSSSMTRGNSEQAISIIPDTGTDELVGISGRMIIDIVNGDHFFTFEYSLEK